jgi:glycosyltransferase involved in cell wall biosynthesis
MMRIFLNGLAASAGGGLTYLRNVIPELGARRDVEATILASSHLRREFNRFENIFFLAGPSQLGPLHRFAWEQARLPKLVSDSGADALISSGNFALRRPPVPQILLSRNALYTSREFLRDLRARRAYRLLLEVRMKAYMASKSIEWADLTIAPTEAFAQDLYTWTGRHVEAIHHGFARSTFFESSTPLALETREALNSARGCLRLLVVSHYNYYRNFETLFRALTMIRAVLRRPVKLFVTCSLQEGKESGGYRTGAALRLINKLGIGDSVVQLGAIPYSSLHQLYSACDLYVTPAYAESFAHPLVEAMACGLPVVASDLAVHREICGKSALYFSHCSPEQLSQRVVQVAESPQLLEELAHRGRLRSKDFSWRGHVNELLMAASRLSGKNLALAQAAS